MVETYSPDITPVSYQALRDVMSAILELDPSEPITPIEAIELGRYYLAYSEVTQSLFEIAKQKLERDKKRSARPLYEINLVKMNTGILRMALNNMINGDFRSAKIVLDDKGKDLTLSCRISSAEYYLLGLRLRKISEAMPFEGEPQPLPKLRSGFNPKNSRSKQFTDISCQYYLF